jgi:phage gpG-like protein
MSETFFQAEVVGLDALIAKFDELPDDILAELTTDIKGFAPTVANNIRKLMPKRSGKLAASLAVETDVYGDSVELYVSSNLRYARIQDQGGKTPPHVEIAKGKAMSFAQIALNQAHVAGTQAFYSKVMHPGGHIKAKEFMLRGLMASRQEFVTITENAVATAVLRDMR